MQESGLYQLYQLFVSPFNRGPALIKQYGEMSKGFLAYLLVFVIIFIISYITEFGFGGGSSNPISRTVYQYPFLDTSMTLFMVNLLGLISDVIKLSIIGWVMNRLFSSSHGESSFDGVMTVIWFMGAYRDIGETFISLLDYILPENLVSILLYAFLIWTLVLAVRLMSHQTGVGYGSVILGAILGGIAVILLGIVVGGLLITGITHR